jgi:hypothetical protein
MWNYRPVILPTSSHLSKVGGQLYQLVTFHVKWRKGPGTVMTPAERAWGSQVFSGLYRLILPTVWRRRVSSATAWSGLQFVRFLARGTKGKLHDKHSDSCLCLHFHPERECDLHTQNVLLFSWHNVWQSSVGTSIVKILKWHVLAAGPTLFLGLVAWWGQFGRLCIASELQFKWATYKWMEYTLQQELNFGSLTGIGMNVASFKFTVL